MSEATQITPLTATIKTFVRRSDEDIPRALGDREWTVLLMLCQGMAIGDIAKKLYLSPKTVSTYRERIMDKTEIRSVAQLAIAAYRQGLV